MERKQALKVLEKLQRVEQLEMQLDQLEHWALNETTSIMVDLKEMPFPSYIHSNLFTESDIGDLIAIVETKLAVALKELEDL